MNAPANATATRRLQPHLLAMLLLCILATACYRKECDFDPCISYVPSRAQICQLPAPFAELEVRERGQEWGKEVYIGRAFAKEIDFYRAITCFKRALILLPKKEYERRFEIEYAIFLSYYIAGKYEDAVATFEGGRLIDVPQTFPVLCDLQILLYDAYVRTEQPERAEAVLTAIETDHCTIAKRLALAKEIEMADLCGIAEAAERTDAACGVSQMLACYANHAKSVTKAKVLNALLPGAGYYYVGQKKSAFTSFLINALFIAASYQLFDRGYIPAAIITTSLELGWYFGGINGAGIEARQYNQCLYERLGRETMAQEKLFPILMIEHGF